MVLDEEYADIIAVIMAGFSVAFMVPALGYAYKIRTQISKALLILAASKNLYRYLFMVLGFATAGSVAHLIYHIAEFQAIPLELELLVHVIIDANFIFISISLFMTFKTAYGMLQSGDAKEDIENKLRQSAKLAKSTSGNSGKSVK